MEKIFSIARLAKIYYPKHHYEVGKLEKKRIGKGEKMRKTEMENFLSQGYSVRWIKNGEQPAGDTWGLYRLFTPAGMYCGRVFGPSKGK